MINWLRDDLPLLFVCVFFIHSFAKFETNINCEYCEHFSLWWLPVNSEPNINIDFCASVRTANLYFIVWHFAFWFRLIFIIIIFHHHPHHHHFSFPVGLAPVLMVHNGRKKEITLFNLLLYWLFCLCFVPFQSFKPFYKKLFALEFEWHSQCWIYFSYYALCPLIPYNFFQSHEYRDLSHARQFIMLDTECWINKSWTYIQEIFLSWQSEVILLLYVYFTISMQKTSRKSVSPILIDLIGRFGSV